MLAVIIFIIGYIVCVPIVTRMLWEDEQSLPRDCRDTPASTAVLGLFASTVWPLLLVCGVVYLIALAVAALVLPGEGR